MRERPILFSAPMVRAILAGKKTQTRRIVSPQPPDHLGETPGPAWNSGFVDVRCPHGIPGDRLWVREQWRAWERDSDGLDHIWYAADDTKIPIPNTKACGDFVVGRFHCWRPSIHMPRWASRITLEITGVRVERLQNISAEDVIEEGIDPAPHACDCDFCTRASVRCPASSSSLVMAYADLWDDINGTGAWAANPWVWALTFRRLPQAEAELPDHKSAEVIHDPA